MRNVRVKTASYAFDLGEAPQDEPSKDSRSILGLVHLQAFFLLYVVSLLILLQGAISLAPAPDEIHWLSRSATLLSRLRAFSFDHLTSHLPHPGIPGTIVMAFGEYFAEKWNLVFQFNPGDAWYLDSLSGARVGASLLAAGFAPLFFLLSSLLFGFRVAFFSALLFALDPYFLAVGRQAHIDAALGILMSASALCFMLAAIRQSFFWQVAAAILWGLALATKPTAVLLLPAFVLIRLLHTRFSASARLCYLRDLWSVVLGVGVFSLLYTRLWHRWQNERFKLNPWRGEDIWVDALVPMVANFIPLLLVATALLFTALIYLEVARRLRASEARASETRASETLGRLLGRVCVHVALLLMLGAISIYLRPEWLRNLSGYCAWVFGLADTPHFAYGRVWDPPPYGYAGLVFNKLPAMILLLGVVGVLSSVWPGTNKRRFQSLCAVIVCLCVAGGLNVSGKQAYRYLLPILPFLYLFAVLGVASLVKRIRFFGSSAGALLSTVLCALVFWQAWVVYSWRAAPQLFHNTLGGGLAAAMQSGAAQAFVQQSELIAWLQEVSRRENRVLRVGVIGDYRIMQKEYLRQYPASTRSDNSSVRFHNYVTHDPGEYIVVYHSMLRRMRRGRVELEKRAAQFAITVHGVRIASIYRSQPPTPGSSRELQVVKFPRRTGGIERNASNEEVLVARSTKHPADYLYYDSYVAVTPGRYRVSLHMQAVEKIGTLDSSRFVLRAEFGSGCKKVFTVADFVDEKKVHTFDCSFDRSAYLQLRGYWFGYLGVELASLEILALEHRETSDSRRNAQ